MSRHWFYPRLGRCRTSTGYDGSFMYTLFACRLQEWDRGCRSAAVQRQITASETMGTVQGIRFRVGVPMMVHALTSAGRVEFQE
eukprot:1639337-Prymnesium_polylepis.1